MLKTLRRGLLVVFAVGGLAGCAVTKVTTALNQPLPEYDKPNPPSFPAPVPRASMLASSASDQPFIGLALSGGGSRAANLSWSVMERLHALGMLQNLDSISSVSGGSLAGALYALNADRLSEPEHWQQLGSSLKRDFLGDWIRRLTLNPTNWFRMATSDVERTHIMAGVFEDTLFGKATFQDLGNFGPGRPRLFLNTTSSTSQLGSEGLAFSEEAFTWRLGSRLDTYPISHAVMASGAFPGVFGNITLNVYGERVYDPESDQMKPIQSFERVYDGGVFDNLGLWTLLEKARTAYLESARKGRPMRGCMLFVVDAYAPNYEGQSKAFKTDTDHKLLDLLVKTTAWDSIDSLLASHRLKTLQAFGMEYEDGVTNENTKVVPVFYSGLTYATRERRGFDEWRRSLSPVTRVKLFAPVLPAERSRPWRNLPTDRVNPDSDPLRTSDALESSAPQCLIWHLSFDRMRAMSDYILKDSKVHTFEPSPFVLSRSGGRSENLQQYGVALTTPSFPDLPAELVAELDEIGTARNSLWALATTLDTNYRLAGPGNCSADFLQNVLRSVAQILVEEDRQSLNEVCGWYREMGLPVRCGDPSPSIRRLPPGTWSTLLLRSDRRRDIPYTSCTRIPEQKPSSQMEPGTPN